MSISEVHSRGVTSDISPDSPQQAPEFTSDIPAAPDVRAHTGGRRGTRARAAAVPQAFAGPFARYTAALARPGVPLDPDTVRAYRSRVRQFLIWLDGADVDGDPLTDADARNGAVRDYRSWLLVVAKRKLTTVNAYLTAVDDFYRHLGLGPAVAKRQELAKTAPRALPDRARTRWLRAVERAAARDKALADCLYYAGMRIDEACALDLDDVQISARKGTVLIRYGKGGRYREVPLHPRLRATLETWIEVRGAWSGANTNAALFLNKTGGRLTSRGAYGLLQAIAADANLTFGREGDLTPHTLRHTAVTNMIRGGQDVIVVAELFGQSVETVRRYSLPTEADKQAAIATLPVDE